MAKKKYKSFSEEVQAKKEAQEKKEALSPWKKTTTSTNKTSSSSSSNSGSARETDQKKFNQSSSTSSNSSGTKKSSSSGTSKSSSSSSKKSSSSSSNKSSSSSGSKKETSARQNTWSDNSSGSSRKTENPNGSSFYDDYLKRKEEQEKSHDLFGGAVTSPFKSEKFTPYSQRKESEKRFTLPSVEKQTSAFSGNGGVQKSAEAKPSTVMTRRTADTTAGGFYRDFQKRQAEQGKTMTERLTEQIKSRTGQTSGNMFSTPTTGATRRFVPSTVAGRTKGKEIYPNTRIMSADKVTGNASGVNGVSQGLSKRLGDLLTEYDKIARSGRSGLAFTREVENLTRQNADIFRDYARETGSELTYPGLIDMFDKQAKRAVSELRKQQDAAVKADLRDATLKDLTVNSFKQGYYNTLYGEEMYKALGGRANNAAAYQAELNKNDYKFAADNMLERAISGAAGQIGQMVRNATNPTTAGLIGAGVGGVAVAGQAGPLVAIPDELLSVPAAAAAGYTAGSAANMLKVEAGLAYDEMLQNGISPETASKIALGVGGLNSALEAVQLDDLLKSFRILSRSGATENVAVNIAKTLLRRGIDVTKETAEEVAQEAVTVGGAQLANKLDKGEWAYSGDEVRNRLLDTAGSSALTFGALGAAGDIAGAGMGAYGDYRDTSRLGREIRNQNTVESVYDEGLWQGTGTEAYRQARRFTPNTASDYRVGRQAELNARAMADEARMARLVNERTGYNVNYRDDMPSWSAGETVTDTSSTAARSPFPSRGRLNINANKGQTIDTLYHETGHAAEALATDEARAAADKTIEILKKPEYIDQFETRKNELKRAYDERGIRYTDEQIEDEIAVDMRRGGLLYRTSADYDRATRTDNYNRDRFVPNTIRRAASTVRSVFGGTVTNENAGITVSAKDANTIREAWERADNAAAGAYRAGNTATSQPPTATAPLEGSLDGVKYNVETDADGNTYVNIDADILDGVPENEYRRTVRQFIKANFPSITVNGEDIIVNADARGEFTNSKYSRMLERTDTDAYHDKLRMANNLDEILQNRENIRNSDPKHSRRDIIVGFEEGDINVKVGTNMYTAKVQIGIRSDGVKVLNDILDIKNTGVVPRVSSFKTNNSGRNQRPVSSDNSITNTDENVKKDFSVDTNALESRLSGDELLNAYDTIEEIQRVGGTVDNQGYAYVYHNTSGENAEQIRTSGKMTAKEDGIFVSTKPDGYSRDYGKATVELKIPVERLVLDDIFDDEAHFRIPLENRNGMLDVSQYLVDGNNSDIRYSVDTNEHTSEQQRVIDEYEAAVDNDILEFAKYAREHKNDNRTSITLSDVSDRAARDIERLTGIDVDGYEHNMRANTIRHIDDGHGANGKTDNSMADDRDIARINYVLENYDNVELLEDVSKEFRDKNQKLAPIIKYSKRVDGNYYVVEAVPDTKAHKLQIVSAYKNKAAQQVRDAQSPVAHVRNEPADTASAVEQQALIMRDNSPQLHAQDVVTDTASADNISQNNGNVKYSVDTNAENTETPEANNAAAYSAAADSGEEQEIQNFMRDESLIDTFNGESASRTDRERLNRHNIIPKAKQFGEKFIAAQIDKLYPIKSYERYAENIIPKGEDGKKVKFKGRNSPYVMATNSIDAQSRAKYILTEQLTDFDANPIGESLADIVGDLSYDDYQDFNTYLKLRHGLEWVENDKDYKPVFGQHWMNDPAAMKAGIRQLDEKHPDFADAAARVYKYQADLMRAWLVDTGIITAETYDKLRQKYPEYVPFFRKDDTPTRGRGKNGIANQGNPIQEAEGGSQVIYDPIESIMFNASKFVNAAAKNAAMQSITDIFDTVPGMEVYMAEAVKDKGSGKYKLKKGGGKTDTVEVAETEPQTREEFEEYISDAVQHAIKLTDGDIVSVLQNGKKRYFKVFDKNFLEAVDNLHPIQVGPVMRAVASTTRMFSAFATNFNPMFTLASNPIKDTQNAFAQTIRKNPFSVVSGIVGAQIEQVRNSDIGKKIGSKKNPDYDGTDIYKKYMAMGGEYASAFSAGRNAINETLNEVKPNKKGAGAAMKNVAKFIPRAYGNVADAIETGPRLSEFKYSQNKAGNDVHQAHFDSKDVTLNFGRSGYVGERINKFVPFYNPSVQGISKMIQSFKNKPLQTSLRVAAMTAISAASLIWNGRKKEDKEEYNNASSYLKNNYYLFHTGDGKFFKVPKSQEYGLVPTLIERAVEKFAYDNPDAFYDFSDYISTALLPSIFKAEFPFVDTGSIIGLGTYTSLLENKDFKGSPIVPDYMQDEVPKEQYDDRTSYIARYIGKALNWSPKKIDYVINSNTGFLGKINESVLHSGEKDYFLGMKTKFSADSLYSTDQVNMFYDNRDEAEKQAKSYPGVENDYLKARYAQSGNVLSIINKIYKTQSADGDTEAARETRRAYVNYARDNKDNPAGLSTEIYDELERLYGTDSKVLSMPSISNTGEIKAKIDGKEQSYSFKTSDEIINYQSDLNKHVDEAYWKLINSDEYKAMDDIDKTGELEKVKKAAVNEVKEFYVQNQGAGRMYDEGIPKNEEKSKGNLFGNLLNHGKETPSPTEPPEEATAAPNNTSAPESTAAPKPTFTQQPTAASNESASAPDPTKRPLPAQPTPNPNAERDNRVNSNIQTIADNLAKAIPEKAKEYSADKLKINRIDSVPDSVEKEAVAAANEEYYSNLDKLMSGELNVEDVVGYTSKGKARTSEQADGTKVELTGKLYNDDGTPRFDEYVMGKILYKVKEAATDNAKAKYKDGGTGESTQVSSTGGLPFETSAEAAEVPERQVGETIAATAEKYVGTPYVWGGESESGWDCSGYVINMFDKFGIHIPERTTEEQWASGTGVRITNQEDLQPGDCLYFEDSSGDVHHVAIYMGDGMMVHAKGRNYGTVTESFANSDYYQSQFIGAKRYYTAGDSTVISDTSSSGTRFRARSGSSGSSRSSRSSGSSRSSSTRFRARETAAGGNTIEDLGNELGIPTGMSTRRTSASAGRTATSAEPGGLFASGTSGGVTRFMGSAALPSRMNGTQLRKTAASRLFKNLMPWGDKE